MLLSMKAHKMDQWNEKFTCRLTRNPVELLSNGTTFQWRFVAHRWTKLHGSTTSICLLCFVMFRICATAHVINYDLELFLSFLIVLF
jgi:hypothetical protein